jgi:hypothetical protein
MVEGAPEPPANTGEGPNPATPGSGGDYEPAHEEVAGRGGEGKRAEQASPKIGDEGEHGQTQVPAPPDDVGVPPDEEMGRDDT